MLRIGKRFLIVPGEKMTTELTFEYEEDGSGCRIINEAGEVIGYLEKVRPGKWQTFGLFLREDFYVTEGCLDLIRQEMRRLNSTANKKKGEKDGS